MKSKDRKNANRLPVDATKLNLGNTYSTPPAHYYDIDFECVDCGTAETWTKEQQKWWYEEAGGYFFSAAIRCRACRAKERDRKSQARRDAGHKPSP